MIGPRFRSMLLSLVCSALVFTLVPVLTADAQQPPAEFQYYRIKSVYVPPPKRPAVEYTLDQLKFRGVSGQLPTFDGEQFQVNLSGEGIQSRDDARRVVGQFLEYLKSPLRMDDQMRMD